MHISVLGASRFGVATVRQFIGPADSTDQHRDEHRGRLPDPVQQAAGEIHASYHLGVAYGHEFFIEYGNEPDGNEENQPQFLNRQPCSWLAAVCSDWLL